MLPLASLFLVPSDCLASQSPNPKIASSLLKTNESLHQGEAGLFKGDTWS